jgi:hypothetical protein
MLGLVGLYFNNEFVGAYVFKLMISLGCHVEFLAMPNLYMFYISR